MVQCRAGSRTHPLRTPWCAVPYPLWVVRSPSPDPGMEPCILEMLSHFTAWPHITWGRRWLEPRGGWQCGVWESPIGMSPGEGTQKMMATKWHKQLTCYASKIFLLGLKPFKMGHAASASGILIDRWYEEYKNREWRTVVWIHSYTIFMSAFPAERSL